MVNRLDARRFSSDITQWLLSEGIRGACWLPLQRGDRSIGVLNVASFHENAFGGEAIELLREIAVLISVAVENALAFEEITELKNRISEEKSYLEDEIRSKYTEDEIISESTLWRTVLQQAETVASTDATVLLLGETGTGKELVAQAVAGSPDSRFPPRVRARRGLRGQRARSKPALCAR